MSASMPDLRAIFAEALERGPGAERRVYLDRACGADHEFRERVDALLGAHSEAGSFLAAPEEPAQDDD